MERVLIVGSPGAGKSTLAAEVARRTGLPLIHLDQHYWQPGWVEPEKSQWSETVRRLIAGPLWVMDGNYGGTMPARLARADTVILLDLPSWLCVTRILLRALWLRGTVRADMAPECPERITWEFLAYTARFRRGSGRSVEARLAGFAGTLIRLRSPAQVRRFLASLKPAPRG